MMETSSIFHLVQIFLAWLGYGLIHSALASLRAKQWVVDHAPGWMPAYRLGFNLIALLLLIPPLYLSFSFQGPTLLAWRGIWAWLAHGLTLAAVAGFLWSLRYYDTAEFLGIRQWRDQEGGIEDQERFRLSPMHRFVRHPWYSFGLVILWSRDLNAAMLLSNLVITAYFLLGSRLEERKLLHYHGRAYEVYRLRVPALIPSPRRFLDRETAREIVKMAGKDDHKVPLD